MLIEEKLEFKNGLMKLWLEEAVREERLTNKFLDTLPDNASYPQ